MRISEVRVKMVSNATERLRAFCSVTLDSAFVIRDLKVIDGANGPFVAMPSRKLSDRCRKCRSKNHLRANYCNECGAKLTENRAPRDPQGRIKLHADVAHPINSECRERIQNAVIEAYEEELNLSQEPGYKPRTDVISDDVLIEDSGDYEGFIAELKESIGKRRSDGDSHRDRAEDTRGAATEEEAGFAATSIAGAESACADEEQEGESEPESGDGEGFASGII